MSENQENELKFQTHYTFDGDKVKSITIIYDEPIKKDYYSSIKSVPIDEMKRVFVYEKNPPTDLFKK